MKPLKPKEALFIAHYLKHLDATAAAIAAGYSRNGAHVQGFKLKKRLAAHLKPVQEKQLSVANLNATDIKEEIRRLSHFDPLGLFNASGGLLHLKDMPPEVRACVKSVEVLKRNTTAGDGVQDEVYKVQFWDKPAALAMAAKHLKLLTDTVTVEHRFPLAGVPDDDLTAALEAALAKRRLLE